MMGACASSAGDPAREQHPPKVFQCRHPVTGTITMFTTDGQRPPGVGEDVKIEKAQRRDGRLSTALQRGLYMLGDPRVVITGDGKRIRDANSLRNEASRLGRTPKLTAVGGGNPHPGLDNESWEQYCRCEGKCGATLMSATGQKLGGRDRAQALKEDWDNYRRANPRLEEGVVTCGPT